MPPPSRAELTLWVPVVASLVGIAFPVTGVALVAVIAFDLLVARRSAAVTKLLC